MNKKNLRTELREYKFEVWGLNYNLGVNLVKNWKNWKFGDLIELEIVLLMKLGTQLLNVRSSGVKLKIVISCEIGVVFNPHCLSSPHPEDRINRRHSQQIMDHDAHDPSWNMPHFWRHEHTTFLAL